MKRRRPAVPELWTCSLDGCQQEALGDADDETWPPVPPEGWVAVRLRRRGWVMPVELDYCSDEHLRQGMASLRVPGPDPRPGERR